MQPLPHSEESERAVLAGAMLDQRLLASCELTETEFYFERHQLIWKAMQDVVANDSGVDIRTIQARLEAKGHLERVGGAAYLAGLDLDLPDLGNWQSYAATVREQAQRRRLMALGARMQRRSQNGGPDLTGLLADAETELRKISEAATPSEFETIGEITSRVLESLEDRSTSHVKGLSTGLAELDRLLGGLKPGHLVIVAGRPSMGKSSLALNVAERVAVKEGKPVAIFSLEMSSPELGLKVLSSAAGVSSQRLMSGHLTQAEWGQVVSAHRRVVKAPMWIDDNPSAPLHEVCARTRRLVSDRGVALLLVDYLQLMKTAGRHDNRNLEVTEITRQLKVLAKELQIPVMALSQLSRQSERRGGDKRPQLSDLRESGAIEQDADSVTLIHREEFYNPDDPALRGLADLIVAKNRHGATGTATVSWAGETTTFSNLASAHYSYRDRSESTEPSSENADCPF